jgi:hypothetical protein
MHPIKLGKSSKLFPKLKFIRGATKKNFRLLG